MTAHFTALSLQCSFKMFSDNLILCVWCLAVCISVRYLCTMFNEHGGQKRTSDALRLESQTIEHCGCWESILHPLLELPVLLITQPALQALQDFYYEVRIIISHTAAMWVQGTECGSSGLLAITLNHWAISLSLVLWSCPNSPALHTLLYHWTLLFFFLWKFPWSSFWSLWVSCSGTSLESYQKSRYFWAFLCVSPVGLSLSIESIQVKNLSALGEDISLYVTTNRWLMGPWVNTYRSGDWARSSLLFVSLGLWGFVTYRCGHILF